MRRLVEARLRSWRTAERRKPLVVRGARQVGKTHTIETFGREEFEETATVDLERNRAWHRVFDGDLDPRRILSELGVLLDRRIVPGRSLHEGPYLTVRRAPAEKLDAHAIAMGGTGLLEDLDQRARIERAIPRDVLGVVLEPGAHLGVTPL